MKTEDLIDTDEIKIELQDNLYHNSKEISYQVIYEDPEENKEFQTPLLEVPESTHQDMASKEELNAFKSDIESKLDQILKLTQSF